MTFLLIEYLSPTGSVIVEQDKAFEESLFIDKEKVFYYFNTFLLRNYN